MQSPALSPKARTLRARKAATRRHDPGADTTELDRDFKVARAEDYIRELIESAPLPTPEQRNRLAALLVSGGAADGT